MIALCHNVGMMNTETDYETHLNEAFLARMDAYAPEDDAQTAWEDYCDREDQKYLTSVWRKAFPSMDEASVSANVELCVMGNDAALKLVNLEQNRKRKNG